MRQLLDNATDEDPKTRLEVQRKLTAVRHQLDLGMPVQRDERVRLKDFLAGWLERVRPSVKPLTHARYGEIVRHVPAETPGRTAITKVTPAQIERLYADLLAAGLPPTTVHQLHSVLHHDLVFTNVIRASYAPLLKRAGVPRVKFHALRHSAATLLLSRGIRPKIVAEMLGHSTISMTLDIYSHVTLDMQHEAAQTMDRLFLVPAREARRDAETRGEIGGNCRQNCRQSR